MSVEVDWCRLQLREEPWKILEAFYLEGQNCSLEQSHYHFRPLEDCTIYCVWSNEGLLGCTLQGFFVNFFLISLFVSSSPFSFG